MTEYKSVEWKWNDKWQSVIFRNQYEKKVKKNEAKQSKSKKKYAKKRKKEKKICNKKTKQNKTRKPSPPPPHPIKNKRLSNIV